ncbi:Chorion transcription factor Cf2 [Portunus trituberculatus]|uniref:Chorion transcription factor Cf2 n=1 Tax=Portunus trituberculatus TaxID=210409 RepID=A0A5B7G0E6_PORTR|nr:Chorion transcription factor Cf2 [Portunus trituberculatus]
MSHLPSTGLPLPDLAGCRLGHQCPICFKKFGLKSDLRRHIRTHTGEKPFACNFCSFRTALKGNLKRHLARFHSTDHSPAWLKDAALDLQPLGEAGRRCPYCPRIFAFPSYLQRHITLHTGEKPFSCTRCDQRYTRRNYLREHYRRKHCVSPPAVTAFRPRTTAATYTFIGFPQGVAPSNQPPHAFALRDDASHHDDTGEEAEEDSLPPHGMIHTSQTSVALSRDGAS